jgi:hypothetical protein
LRFTFVFYVFVFFGLLSIPAFEARRELKGADIALVCLDQRRLPKIEGRGWAEYGWGRRIACMDYAPRQRHASVSFSD